MTQPAKPEPVIDDGNRVFWESAADGVLRMQRCNVCNHLRYPIQAICPRCLSGDHIWSDLSGRGHVYAMVVYHRPFHPAFAADIPYNVVQIQLEEGPRMFSNIVGDHARDFSVGDPVTVDFERVSDRVAIPRFRIER